MILSHERYPFPRATIFFNPIPARTSDELRLLSELPRAFRQQLLLFFDSRVLSFDT